MRDATKGVLLITHYQRLLDVVKPDRVSVLADGRIVQTGGPDLALRLEDEGYDAVMAEAAA
jgi:Fe-S cluster assembly ATP-binding protein